MTVQDTKMAGAMVDQLRARVKAKDGRETGVQIAAEIIAKLDPTAFNEAKKFFRDFHASWEGSIAIAIHVYGLLAAAPPPATSSAEARPERVQASIDAWRDRQRDGAGGNASVLIHYIEQLEASLSALQAGTEVAVKAGIAVKPLEWASEPPYSVARVSKLSLLYSTECVWDEGKFLFCILSGNCINQQFATLAEAKAAAQSDFESRIRSALVEAPVQQAGAESELVERLLAHDLDRVVFVDKDDRHAWMDKADELLAEAAASLSQFQQRIADLEGRLATAYRVKAECNDDANAERRLRIAAEAALEAKDAKLAEAEELIERIPAAINSAFMAGGEEREGGSANRQERYMQPADALRNEARSFTSIQEKGNG